MNLGREGIAFVMILNDFVRMLLCFRDSSQEVQLLKETTAGLEGQLSSAHSDLLNAKGDIERCVQVSGLRLPPSPVSLQTGEGSSERLGDPNTQVCLLRRRVG